MNKVTFRKGMIAGAIGGLAATIAIDLAVVGIFPLLGIPVDVSFSVIGNTAAGFFSMLGLPIAGGVPLGVVIHYMTGPALGAIWGVIVSRRDGMRAGSLKKNIGWGILYTEIISSPLLVTASLILRMTASGAAQWFGVSIVMHAVYGAVLAAVVWYTLRRSGSQAAVGLRPLG